MKKELLRLVNSFKYATNGIIYALRTEKNIRIHVVIGIIACLLGWILQIKAWEWTMVIALFGGMLSLELLNSAIERTVDLATKEYHPLAKHAKDLAAGAVFVFAIISVMIGVIIFGKYLLLYFKFSNNLS